ncbi:hypothetical protein CFC21_049768 [Triticum aestivum]|uniref:GRF-type domain-containing protein n=2 Tax=Triticum aestivum TaxID=4565 RepID=A0A9R1K3S7_WHEAT|nr:uncharacterized protein LOC123080500 [Triticum aestivum]XP_044359364.1 uncharacterized protein LOC123080500 [Triticum aestivum]XP_044359366.1 uncharacterized protein LOC123080500 [Triticum aestivum]KAF7039820.1 hypothetical protein CFC21_049768 [Triticum aestivum]
MLTAHLPIALINFPISLQHLFCSPISSSVLVSGDMSASSSSSLLVPADWLLPLMACPLCGHELVTAVARSGNNVGHRFYKCIRYDSRQCRFFEFQRAYCMRMTHEQILAVQHQAGWHPPGFGFAPQQGNGPSQMVPAAIQPQIQAQLQPQMQPQTQPQIQAPMQQLPPAGNNMIADAGRPAAGVGAAYGAQGLAAVVVLMAAVNIMLTVLLLMVVLAK